MRFEFATATRIIFGRGAIREMEQLAGIYGAHPLIVTGRRLTMFERLAPFLIAKGISWSQLSVSGEPSVDIVLNGVQQYHAEACDFVIGIGGGSVLDAAKAIAALATNPGDPMLYLEVVGQNQPLVKPSAPLIAIPTTAGTGSEVTRNAVLTVPSRQIKVSLRSSLMLAKLAIIDPELTLTVSPEVTASTGMDALCQVIEPFVSRKATWMTDMFCREGIRCAASSLARAYHDGNDYQAREAMAWASLLGGLALANGGLGAVHGFAGPIGGMFAAPHGAICAKLLPRVVFWNVRALRSRQPDSPMLDRYREMSGILLKDDRATVEDGVRYLENLCVELNIPALSAYGIKPSDIPAIIEKARVSSSMQANPIELNTEEMSAILTESL